MERRDSRDLGDSSRAPTSRRHLSYALDDDEYELRPIPHQTQDGLFPVIKYNFDDQSHANNWSDVHSNTQSVISIIDDAASSVCLDDIGAPLEDMAKTIYNMPIAGISNSGATHDRLGTMSLRTSTSMAGQITDDTHGFTDFDEYNRRTAVQVLAEKKMYRRNKRQLRRRLRQQRQELYFGNYFNKTESEPGRPQATNSTLRVSYNVDHFNGHRQNESYNHQLNLMFARNNNLRINSANNTLERYNRDNGLTVTTTAASYMTDNIDDMSSSDGRNSDEDDLFDDDESSYSSSDDDEENGASKWFPRKGLKRRLMSRHLTSTAFAGAIGVSSMLAMGQALFASGPLGSLLGFVFAGIITYSVLMSYGEMVSFLPLHTGIPGVIARFVDPSMGTAIGFCYWFSNAIALPLELTAAAMMLTDYKELAEPGVTTVWIIVILFLVLIFNLCHTSVYGEFQFMLSMVRVGLIFSLTIVLIAINRGAVGPLYETIGFRFWKHSKSDFSSGLILGPFRQLLPVHVLYKSNTEEINVWGIPGAVGRFLQIWQATITGSRALMGSDMVFSSVGEARNPRRSLARATRWIFWRIIFFYILGIFIFGISIYAGDSNLIMLGSLNDSDDTSISSVNIGIMVSSVQKQHESCSPTASKIPNTGLGFNSIPWIVALQTVSMCTAAEGINAVFVIFAISAGSAQLYASSRTLYGLVRMHIDKRKIKHSKHWWLMPGWCSQSGMPTCAMLLSFPFAFLAFLTLHTSSFTVFNLLINISSTAAVIVWAGMALAFLRFYYAVKLTQRRASTDDPCAEETQNSRPPGMICRDDIVYPFRSILQPWTAWFGLVGCLLIAITQGYLVFLRTNWNLNSFVASYISPFLFVVVYVAHKLLTRSTMPSISKIDLESDRREIERAEWAEDRKYGFNFFEIVRKNWSVITGNRYHRRRRRSNPNETHAARKSATASSSAAVTDEGTLDPSAIATGSNAA